MPTELSRSENVFTALKLTEAYNNAGEHEKITRRLDVTNMIGQMDIDERYSFYIRILAKARNVVPELIDVEMEYQCESADVETKFNYMTSLMAEKPDIKPN